MPTTMLCCSTKQDLLLLEFVQVVPLQGGGCMSLQYKSVTYNCISLLNYMMHAMNNAIMEHKAGSAAA